MSDVEQRQIQRYDYLVALYRMTEGGPTYSALHREVAERAGIDPEVAMRLAGTLTTDHMISFPVLSGDNTRVAISPTGMARAQQIMQLRERAGEQPISGTVVLTDPELRMKLEPLVATIRGQLDGTPDLDADTRADLESDLQSATDQLRAARPNRGVIKAALGRINEYVPTIAALTGTGAAIFDILHGLGL